MADKEKNIPVLKIDMPLKPAGQTQPEADNTTRRLYDDSYKGVVQIVTNTGMGSGFVVKDNKTVITDAHVVMDSTEVKIRDQRGRNFKAKIQDYDDLNDLAILEIVSDKRTGLAPLKLTKSDGLLPDEKVYALGHPRGLKDLYISPGYYRESISQQQLYDRANLPCRIDDFALSPKEKIDLVSVLDRKLLSARVHIEPGNSGGPLLNERGQVAGVSDIGNPSDRSDAYFTPASKVNDLLAREVPKFQFKYEYAPAQWAMNYYSDLSHDPATAATKTAFVGGLGGATYWTGKRMSPLGRNIAGFALGTGVIMSDADELVNATDSRDKLKYGVAVHGDLNFFSGLALQLAQRNNFGGKLVSKAGPYGKSIMLLGAAERLGAEFIPNRLTLTDVSRTDGDMRAPFAVDLSNLKPKADSEKPDGKVK
jgi:hypothetical protein